MLTNKAKIIIGVTSLLVLGGLISNQVIFEKRIQRLEEKNVTVVETVVTPSSTPSAALTATPSVTKAPTFIQRSVTATPTN